MQDRLRREDIQDAGGIPCNPQKNILHILSGEADLAYPVQCIVEKTARKKKTSLCLRISSNKRCRFLQYIERIEVIFNLKT
jgi:hypothetical protein